MSKPAKFDVRTLLLDHEAFALTAVGQDESEAETPSITLLPAECLLRELLLECAQEFPGLEIWITGGWVRDRLLGIPSMDIDLALSNLTGRQFGQYVEAFCARPEIEAKYSQLADELGVHHAKFIRFHIVERNADASKKLETAGGQLFGLDIDLINLRKEVYDGQSRTPEMNFGTAEEDAFRRDATVNSLFFHLERKEVVDHTGRGLKDLDRGVMATPLDPRKTFMDDPLRVLRLIRVASKLDFAMDPEVMACMRTEEVRQALDQMITRDRINVEIFKIMRQPHPGRAFEMIFEADLYIPVFLRFYPATMWAIESDLEWHTLEHGPEFWPEIYRLLADLLKGDSNVAKMVQSVDSVEDLWTMAACAPLDGVHTTARPDKTEEIVQAATDAIRLPARISKIFESGLRNGKDIVRMTRRIVRNPADCKRSEVGMAIRSWGPHWTTQVTYRMLAGVRFDREDDLKTRSQLDAYHAFADFV